MLGNVASKVSNQSLRASRLEPSPQVWNRTMVLSGSGIGSSAAAVVSAADPAARTAKKKPMRFDDWADFIRCYNPHDSHARTATWDEKTAPEGRCTAIPTRR